MAAEGLNRPTPWSVVFAPLEARYAGLAATADPAAFSQDPEAQRLLDDIQSPELLDADPSAATEYAQLLFADVQHWRAGRPVRPASPDLSASLPFAAPPRAPVYIQFPTQAFWMQPDPDGPHEPLDGCYVVPVAGNALVIVAILGLRPGRRGLSQVTLLAATDDLAAAGAALPDDPYTPEMAGGASAGFRSVRTGAELLHLVHLALAPAEP